MTQITSWPARDRAMPAGRPPRSLDSLPRGLPRMPRLVPLPVRFLGALASLALLALASSCGDSLTQPRSGAGPVRMGQLGVYAQSNALAASGTLVVQVSGPGIVKSDGATPDTLAFNIAMSGGVAAGSITVPAGPQRVITVRAFDGLTETHRGSVTTDIVVGANPTVTVTLVPLVGDVTVSVSIGTTIVIVRPGLATLSVGDTLRMTAEIRDQNGGLVTGRVRWATLNPVRASVDTLGLVTMRDTGEVQIVATYGTVGGGAKLSGTPRSSAVAYQLTWNGSVNRNWSEPNNWTPHGIGAARVPTGADSVVITAAPANQPIVDGCLGDRAARDLVVQAGASISYYCNDAINVYRGAWSKGAIATRVLLRPGATVAGIYGELYVMGDSVQLADSVRATNLEVNAPGANLLLRGRRLRVTSDLRVYNGTITLTDGDTLEVSGNVSWQGSDQTGRLDGGVVLFHGSDFYGYRYKAGGTNRLVFDRATAGQQTISGFNLFASPLQSSIQRWDVRNVDGVRLCGHLALLDTVTFRSTAPGASVDNASCGGYYARAYGPVVSGANVSVSSYLWELRHVTGTSLVAGAWSPVYTDIYQAGTVVKPSLAYQHLRFYAAGQLSGRTTVTGNLLVEGPGSDLVLGGNRIAVGGNLDLNNNAVVTMTNAADSLVVTGNTSFNSDTRAAELARITTGYIETGGNFYGYGFNASGTNRVRLTATGGTNYVSGLNFLSFDQGFQELELAPSSSLGACAHLRVRGTLSLGAAAALREQCGGYYVRIDGDLVTAAGSSVTPYLVELRNPTGTQNVNGTFAPQNTSIYTPLAPGQLKAGLGYGNMGIYAAVALPANMTVSGDLTVSTPAASLTLNGHTLTVTGNFAVSSSATMSMASALDSLVLNGTGNWSGAGSHVGKLTAGTMVLRGPSVCLSNFAASGTHTTVFDRTGSGVRVDCVSGSTPQNTPLNRVEVRNYGVTLNCHLYAAGRVRVFTGAKIEGNCNGGNLWVQDTLATDAGSAITNGPGYPGNGQLGVVLADSAGTSQVTGAYDPHMTYFSGLHARIRPDLAYRNGRIDRSTTLLGAVTFNGTLELLNDGTIVALGGQHLRVAGGMDFNNNSQLRMDNVADTLDVATNDETAYLYWDGADNTGLLTAGVVRFNGARFYGPRYHATGTQKFIFTSNLSAAPVSVEGSPSFRRMDITGTRSVNISGVATVLDTLNIATATQLLGTNYLVVGSGTGTLLTVPGSDVSMPSVYLDGPTGTRFVQGRFRPTNTYFRAAAPVADAIQPGLEYNSIHVEGPYQLAGSMTIGGDISVETSIGELRLNGNRLTAGGHADIYTGGALRMQLPGDSLMVGGHVNLAGDGGVSTLSDGVIRVSGDFFYLQRAGSGATGNHKVVLAATGTGYQDLYTSGYSGQHDIRNLEVTATRTVRFNSNVQVSGGIAVKSPTTVTTNALRVGGSLSSVAGSVILPVGVVELSDASGTSLVQGGYRSTSSTRFLAGASTIAVRNAAIDSIGYRGVEVVNAGTVTGGPLKTSGDLYLPSSASSLTLPDGSVIGGNADSYGTLTFGGGATGGTYLFVRGGGRVTASSATAPVDFVNLYLYSGGKMDNTTGSATSGFRYKTGSTFYNGAVNDVPPGLTGPAPTTW